MFRTNVADIKARLSEYLERAAQGERIVICRHNKPIAELRAVENPRVESRPLGPLTGRPTFEVPLAFLEPLFEDELDQWEGNEPAREHDDLRSGRARGASRVAQRRAADGPRQRRNRSSGS